MYTNEWLISNFEEQYGPVCGASSVATVVNYLTASQLDTKNILEYFIKHRLAILDDTLSFLNRNIEKMKMKVARENLTLRDTSKQGNIYKPEDSTSREETRSQPEQMNFCQNENKSDIDQLPLNEITNTQNEF